MNVILYVMDSLRADHLSALGYHRTTTPVLDQLAREGVIFSNCFAQCGWTAPSCASMLSSQYPTHSGIRKMRDVLPQDTPWLPEILQGHGYRTCGVTAMIQIASHFGYDRGYDDFYDVFADPETIELSEQGGFSKRKSEICLPLSEHLNRHSLKWLDAHTKEHEFTPFFQLIWSIDTHEPFDQPASFNVDVDPNYRGLVDPHGRPYRWISNRADLDYVVDLYDGSIRYQDAQLGMLVDELRRRDLLDDTLLIVVGDHGEMFFEHGLIGHGKFPWEEQMRVPLIMRCPQVLPQGKRCDALAQTMDIAATVLDLAGLEPQSRFRGKSLRPLIDDEISQIHEAVVLEVPSPFTYEECTRVVRGQQWKYIEYQPPGFSRRAKLFAKEFFRGVSMAARPSLASLFYGHSFQRGLAGFTEDFLVRPLSRLAGGKEKHLYHLAEDPHEMRNLIRKNPQMARQLASHLEVLQDRPSTFTRKPKMLSSEQNARIRQQLEDLGYVEN